MTRAARREPCWFPRPRQNQPSTHEQPRPLVPRGDHSARRRFPCFLDVLKYVSVGPATDSLGGQQPGPPALAFLDVSSRLLEPVATQVRFRPNPVAVDLEQALNVGITEFGTQFLAAEERGVADDEFGLLPLRFLRPRWVATIQYRVHQPDALDWV